MVLLRLLFVALVTAVFILGGLHFFVEWQAMEEKIAVQNAVIAELAHLATEPQVDAKLNRTTGDLVVRVNKNNARLISFPGFCPIVLEL